MFLSVLKVSFEANLGLAGVVNGELFSFPSAKELSHFVRVVCAGAVGAAVCPM